MGNKGYSIDVAKKKCVTPIGRGSYMSILEPSAFGEGDEPDWNMLIIFPKDPTVNKWVDDMKKIYAQVLIDKFGKEKAQAIAKAISIKERFPIRDGDGDAAGDLANAEQLEGCYFMSIKNKFRQPHIIGATGAAVDPTTLTPDDIYSGAWYRVMLNFYYYKVKGNQGIGASLEALMKVKDDENLGANTTAKEASDRFADFSDDAVDLFAGATEDDEKMAAEEESKEKVEDDTFDFMN